MDDVRQLLKVSDIAPALGVSASRVYQLVEAGIIPVIRVGGSLRIPREAWERWLAQKRDRALEAVRES